MFLSRRIMTLASAAVVAVSLAACGGGTSIAMPSGSAPATAITIKNFVFSPNPLAAKVGDTITITNDDGTDHSVTADDRSFDTGRFASGSRTITVSHAGTVTFHCQVHPSMTGVIQVAG